MLVKTPFIATFLKDARSLATSRERILLITTGYGPLSHLERTVLRPVTVFIRRALFIFTENRFFIVPTTFRHRYRHSIAEIRYSDCTAIQLAGRSLIVVFKRGTQLEFPFIGGRERRKLGTMLPLLPVGGYAAKHGGMRPLCPECTNPLSDTATVCSSCKLEFKSVATAGRMALFLPGGGYFYTSNIPLAVACTLIEAALITGMIIGVLRLATAPVVATLILAGTILAMAGVKAIAFFHARQLARDIIPQ